MTDIAIAPDIDRAVRDLVPTLVDVPAGQVRREAPTPGTDPADPLPAVQVYAFDGDSDQLGGYAVLDVHVYAATYAQASLLARTLDAKLLLYPHRVGNVLLDTVTTVSSPKEIEFVTDNSIRRFQATYTVSYRR